MKHKRPEKTRFYQSPHVAGPQAPLTGNYGTGKTYSVRQTHLVAGALLCIGASLAVSGVVGYQVMRSDMMADATAEKTELVLQYQDRIDHLRAEVERLTSRQLVDRESVEIQVMDLLRRQQDLNQRHTIVADLVARAESVGIYLSGNQPVPAQKPAIDANTLASADDDDREAIGGESELIEEPVKALGLREAPSTPFDPLALLDPAAQSDLGASPKKNAEKRGAFDAIKANISDMGTESTVAVDAITVATESRIEHILSVTNGMIPALGKAIHETTSLGGPFEPITSSTFPDRLERANAALKALKRVKFAALRLPVKRPVRNGRLSSGYGPRMDPFLNRLAMHSGLDFKAPYGARVFAAAPGTVILAGWKGGYGKMVEIRHANGFVTRYAHLSRFQVKEGDHVVAGDLVGNIGSTGRSTGPHLHYEIRRNDRPTDPSAFLRAGEKLARLTL